MKTLVDNLAEIKRQKETYIIPENIKKDVTVLGVTGTLEEGIDTTDATAVASDIMNTKTAYVNGEKVTGTFSIETELTAQEQKLEALETILEGKVGGGSSKPNIFLQETEPNKKQGIWLKVADKEYEKVVAEDTVVEAPSWLPDGTARNIPYGYMHGSAVTIGTDIYLLGGANSGTYNYKYDTLTNSYTQLKDIPYQFYNGSAVAIGTNIYLLGGSDYKTYNYKYDTLTDTYTQLRNIPYNFFVGSAVAIGTDIYLLGGQGYKTYNYKYDTLTDTYTKMTDIPYNFYYGTASVLNNDIYLLSGAYVAKNYNYKYNTVTDTYTKMTDIPYEVSECGFAVTVNNNIYLFGGYPSSTKVQVLEFPSSEFEDKSILLLNGNTYKTQLFTSDLVDSSVKYNFSDVWLYEDETGLLTDIPTYFGDGTQWINIKNPSTEGGNE